MYRNLIFQLSLFGLVMSVATVFWIPYYIEPFFWLAIFIYCSILIAKKCYNKFFLHGFMVGILNGVWMTVTHVIFFESYIPAHPDEIALMEKLPLPYTLRVSMVLIGPALGAASGVILGLFCIIASKMVKGKKHAA